MSEIAKKLRALADAFDLEERLSQELARAKQQRQKLEAVLRQIEAPFASLSPEALAELRQVEVEDNAADAEEAAESVSVYTYPPKPLRAELDRERKMQVELDKEQRQEAGKGRRHQVDEKAAWDEQPTHATAVLALLQRWGGQASVARIADAMVKQRNTTLDSVTMLLRTMTNRGEIRRVKRGVYGLISEVSK